MALLHSHVPQNVATLPPIISAFASKPLCISLPHPSSIAHQRCPLFTTVDLSNRPRSLSTLPRKLLCKPPQGKHVREDYLVKKLSAQEVQELVKGERNVPLIIDFYATWCGPCILMAQELEMIPEDRFRDVIEHYLKELLWLFLNVLMAAIMKPIEGILKFESEKTGTGFSASNALAVEYENNAMIVKVDTDDEYEFARDMQVRGLPTLFFISPDPNKDAIRTEGLIPIQMMRDIIDGEM